MSDKKFLDLVGLKHFKDKVQAEIDEKAALPTTVNDKYLHTNATTGEYEWVDVTSGGGTVKKVKVNDTEFAPDADGMVNIGTYLTTHQDISGKLDKNPAVVAGSACKITFDSKGLVTAGGNLSASDIPNIAQSQVTGLTGALTAKQDISTLETDVAAKGFTKNAGTITEIKMNGSSKGTSGVVDLGTVITEHQDITGKLNVLGNETGSGEPYKLPYYFEKTADATQIVVKAHTITMDNAKSIGSYTMAIPSASSSLAGLMSGADKTRLDAIQLTDASVAGGTLTLTRKDGNVTFTKTEVLDSLTSTSTDIALSANKGKELNDRIDNVSSMGRFLSMWDSSGGKPYDDPPGTGDYPYKSGDYYIIGNVSSTGPNYRPDGSVYQRMTSTTVEPDSVHVNDIYRYTTSGWVLQSQEEKVIAFSTIAGQPRDNSNLAAEFDKQIHLLGTAPGSTEQYHFPYNINAIVQNADSISTSFDTVTLDNTKTKVTYPIAIPGADIANNKAGLYTKALADAKADASALTAEVTRATGAEATLTSAVSTEKTRAEGAESDLGDRIDDEDARAQAAETALGGRIDAEVTRATGAEGTLTTNLATEVTNRTNADTALQTSITNETTRATAAETALQTAIDGKISLLGNEAGSGGPYHFTYYYGFTPAADKITAYVDTITLDNNKTLQRFSTDIVGASTTAAGLMTAADKTKLNDANIKDASVSGTTLTLTRATGGDITFTGGPSAFIKSASISGNTFTLKDQDGTDIAFTPINVISDTTTGATDKTYSQSKIIALIEALGGTFFGTFASHAALVAATGMVKNDYAVVTTDEDHSNATTMYYYTGTAWLYAYTISTAPLTFKTVNGETITGTGNVQIIDDTLTTSTTRTYSVDKINTLTAEQDVNVELEMTYPDLTLSGTIATADLPRLATGQGSLIAKIMMGATLIGYSRVHLSKLTVGSDVFFNGAGWVSINTDDTGLHIYQPIDITVNPTTGAVNGGVSLLSANAMDFSISKSYNPGTIGNAFKTLDEALSDHVGDEDVHVAAGEKDTWNAKTTVTASASGTATSPALQYLTVEGTEWKVPQVSVPTSGSSTTLLEYLDVNGTEYKIPQPTSAAWGSITGTLSSQTDLNNALDGKINTANIKTSWGTSPGDGNVPSEKLVKDSLDLKASTSALETHTNNGDIHVTSTQKSAWDAKASASDLTALTTRVTTAEGNITALSTDKLNVSDVLNILTSTATNKALSAAQGKVLNDAITALTSRVAAIEANYLRSAS